MVRIPPERMAEPIDASFKARVRDVIDGRPVTEAELRRLFEEGRACALILDGQLANSERTLAELTSDPESSLADVATDLRRVNELGPELAEVEDLLAELEEHARKFRTSWVSAR